MTCDKRDYTAERQPESTSEQGHCTGVSFAAMARPQVVLLLLSLLLASTVLSMPDYGVISVTKCIEGVASQADCDRERKDRFGYKSSYDAANQRCCVSIFYSN